MAKLKILKSFSIYVSTLVIDRAVGFLILPLLTAVLSTEELGKYTLLWTMINVALNVTTLQVRAPLTTEFFKLSKEEYPRYFSSALVNVLPSWVGFTLLSVPLSWYIAPYYQVGYRFILLLPTAGLLFLMPMLYQTLRQMQKKASDYAVFTLSGTLMRLALIGLLVFYGGWGYRGMYYAIMGSCLVQTLWAVWMFSKEGLFRWDIVRAYRIDALVTGVGLTPHVLGAMVLESADRFFIAHIDGREAVGIYAVAYTLGNIVGFVVHAFVQAWNPVVMQRLAQDSETNRYLIVLGSYVFGVGIMLAALGLWVVSPLIYWFLPSSYAAGAACVGWVAVGVAFLGWYKTATTIIFFTKKTYYLSMVSVLNVVLTFGLDYYLVKAYGMVGAAYATAISYFVFFVVVFVIARQQIALPWGDLRGLWAVGRRLLKNPQEVLKG